MFRSIAPLIIYLLSILCLLTAAIKRVLQAAYHYFLFPQTLQRLVQILEENELPYWIGGSLAYRNLGISKVKLRDIDLMILESDKKKFIEVMHQYSECRFISDEGYHLAYSNQNLKVDVFINEEMENKIKVHYGNRKIIALRQSYFTPQKIQYRGISYPIASFRGVLLSAYFFSRKKKSIHNLIRKVFDKNPIPHRIEEGRPKKIVFASTN